MYFYHRKSILGCQPLKSCYKAEYPVKNQKYGLIKPDIVSERMFNIFLLFVVLVELCQKVWAAEFDWGGGYPSPSCFS